MTTIAAAAAAAGTQAHMSFNLGGLWSAGSQSGRRILNTFPVQMLRQHRRDNVDRFVSEFLHMGGITLWVLMGSACL